MRTFIKYFHARKTTFTLIALFCIGISIYANSFKNDMFWDDNDWILNNAYVHNFQIGKFFSENLIAGSGLQSNYWRPLLLIIHAIEWKLWGASPIGYHVVSVLIHVVNALLVFLLFSGLLKKYWLAFFSSLLFLIHPLQTEAVTYVAGRGDPLSLFFTLTGMYTYFLYTKTEHEKKKICLYFVTLGTFVLALLSKERAVIFPVFLLLIDFWNILETKKMPTRNARKNIVYSIFPFLLIAGIFLVLRGTILNFGNTFNIYGTETYYTSHISARTLTFFHTIPTYLSLVFAPITLYMERSENMRVIISFFDTQALFGIALSLGVFGYALSRIQTRPEYLFGAFFFAIGIFPASGIFVPVAGLIQEHYMYTPIIGIGLFLGTVFMELWNFRKVFWKITLSMSIGIWLLLLCGRTIMRNAEWRDAITFYTQTLAHAPTSLRVWNNLGMVYDEQGLYEKALDAYEHALTQDSTNPIPLYNAGNTYEKLGNIKKAKEYWRAALDRNPNFTQAWIQLRK